LKIATPKRIETDATSEKQRELPVGRAPEWATTTAVSVAKLEIYAIRDAHIATP
jgi:hypothetical protein